MRDKHHRLRNAPYVDNSCKWAGGGFLSNVHDLVRFGNAMLYSFQHAQVYCNLAILMYLSTCLKPGNLVQGTGREGRGVRLTARLAYFWVHF